MRRAFLIVILAIGISGCVAPGKDALQVEGIKESLKVSGDYKAVAYCITTALDNEKWGVMDLRLPVTRSLVTPTGGIELQGGGEPPSVLIWTAQLEQGTDQTTDVTLIGRRDAHPMLSSNYVIDKIRAAVKSCDNKR